MLLALLYWYALWAIRWAVGVWTVVCWGGAGVEVDPGQRQAAPGGGAAAQAEGDAGQRERGEAQDGSHSQPEVGGCFSWLWPFNHGGGDRPCIVAMVVEPW